MGVRTVNTVLVVIIFSISHTVFRTNNIRRKNTKRQNNNIYEKKTTDLSSHHLINFIQHNHMVDIFNTVMMLLFVMTSPNQKTANTCLMVSSFLLVWMLIIFECS